MKKTAKWAMLVLVMFSVLSCGHDRNGGKRGTVLENRPQFVLLGSDDNGISGMKNSFWKGGISFFLDLLNNRRNPMGQGQSATFDGSELRMTFFMISSQLLEKNTEEPAVLAEAWRAVYQAGHELALHTHTHPHGHDLDAFAWSREMTECRRILTAPLSEGGIGISASDLVGFRAPYLEYNPAVFVAMERMGLRYDCSIEEGVQPQEDGRNYPWPYRLDQGSPGDAFTAQGHQRGSVGSHPTVWEIPVHMFIVPPDEVCADYGQEPGLRNRLAKRVNYFNPVDGKITGFDWNLWVEFAMTRAEFLGTLKYSFDLRLQGNRAPFHLGLHSDIYSDGYETLPATTPSDRQGAIRDFLDYVLSKSQTRVVSFRDLLKWLEKPTELKVVI